MQILESKPIAITGASSGIGLATARLCAQAGMPVALAARRIDRLEKLAAEINAGGGKAIAIECDVSHEADCQRFIARTLEAFGSIYSVFANAGYGIEGSVAQATDYDIRQIFETNFFGSLNVIRPVLPLMLEAKSGHILFCSSCLSKMGMPFFASYSATKAAQDHIARGMRIELAGTGINVSSVHPVGTRTEFFDVAAQGSTIAPLSTFHAPRTPPRFMQPPERVARAVIRCLKEPKGEVWTSWTARTAFGLGVIFPGITDAILARAVKR